MGARGSMSRSFGLLYCGLLHNNLRSWGSVNPATHADALTGVLSTDGQEAWSLGCHVAYIASYLRQPTGHAGRDGKHDRQLAPA